MSTLVSQAGAGPIEVIVKNGGSGTTLTSVLAALAGVALGALLAGWRLKKQLAHERELKELEALTNVIDDAAATIASAKMILARLVKLWGTGVRADDPMVVAASTEQRSAVENARIAGNRLALRLASDDPILTSYGEARNVFDEITEIYKKRSDESGANYVLYDKQLEELGKKLGDSVDVFLEHARVRVGPKSEKLTAWKALRTGASEKLGHARSI